MNTSLYAVTLGTALVCLPTLAHAQAKTDYPNRPIRVVVPSSAASAVDFTARAMAPRFTEAWGQQVVIDNRAGAGGIIAHDIAAKATADGYTLILSTSSGLVLNPLLHKTPYDSFKDFIPISLVSVNPQMLFSNPGVAAKSVSELIALAKAKPGQLNCASAGTGTPNHMGCELLKSMGGINFTHVPYKGATPGITDVIGGQAQFMFNSIPAVLPHTRGGRLRALGVAGPKRSPVAPDVPTVAETLPGFECVNWYAMLAPTGTPPVVISKINSEILKMIADPPFAKRLLDMGSEPQSSSSADLANYMRKETARWDKVIKSAGIKVER